MRIYGRITIFGEYLMHGDKQGLIMPSDLYLETTDKRSYISTYNESLDSVLSLIKEKGIIPPHTLKGNLPLGYGFGGSTMLSFLHLSHLIDSQQKTDLINEIDEEIHGFTPSGLDYESCLHQQCGLYCKELGWQSIKTPVLKNYSIVIFQKEKKISLSIIQERVLSAKNTLTEIQHLLNETVKRQNIIDLKLLMEYSKILSSLGVYSISANEFISAVLEKGYIAKGIGGLYGKAIIVTAPNFSKEKCDELVLSYGGTIVN